MKRLVFLTLAAVLLSFSSAWADSLVVTSGTFVTNLFGGYSIQLNGDNFSLTKNGHSISLVICKQLTKKVLD
jgi:hypothetical protein